MKLKLVLTMMVASLFVCSDIYGQGLLDRMMGRSGCGCASSCCDTPADSCGGCEAQVCCQPRFCMGRPNMLSGCGECGGFFRGMGSRMQCDGCGSGCDTGCAPACDSGCGGGGGLLSRMQFGSRMGCGGCGGCATPVTDDCSCCDSGGGGFLANLRARMASRSCGCPDPCQTTGCPDTCCDSGCGGGCNLFSRLRDRMNSRSSCGCADPCQTTGCPDTCCDTGCGGGGGGLLAGLRSRRDSRGCGCADPCQTTSCDTGCGCERVSLLDRIRARMASRNNCCDPCATDGGCGTATPVQTPADGTQQPSPAVEPTPSTGGDKPQPSSSDGGLRTPAPSAPIVDPSAFISPNGHIAIGK